MKINLGFVLVLMMLFASCKFVKPFFVKNEKKVERKEKREEKKKVKKEKTTITNEQTGTTNKSRQAKEKKHEQIYITQRYLSWKRMS